MPPRTQALTHLEGWELEAVPPVRLKAGQPNDSDFFGIPRDGFTVLDTTNSVLWSRIGGVWVPVSGGAVRVRNSAAITITTATTTVLTYDSETDDPLGWHDTVNPSRVTAIAAGRYLMGALIEWAASVAGYRQLEIKLNGVTSLGYRRDQAIGTAVPQGQTITTEWSMAAGDYIEAYVFQTSGGNLNVTSVAELSPAFWMVRV